MARQALPDLPGKGNDMRPDQHRVVVSWNYLGLTHTEKCARPRTLGLGKRICFVLGDEQGCIPTIGPQLVVAHREREMISVRFQQQSSERIGKPGAQFSQAVRSCREPILYFYSLIGSLERNELSDAQFALRELCARAAKGSLERIPV